MGLRGQAINLIEREPGLQASQKLAAQSIYRPVEEDVTARNQLRNLAMQRLQGIGGGAQKEQFLTDQQRAQASALAQARRQFAGTGLAGSLQAGRTLGDILNQQQAQTQRGLLNLQNQELGQIGQLAGIQQGIFGQGFAEQQLQGAQASRLVDLLNRQAEVESGVQAQRYAQKKAEDAALMRSLGALVGGGAALYASGGDINKAKTGADIGGNTTGGLAYA